MNKIDYNLGLLERFVSGSINNKPYVFLDDAKYILKNSGVIEEDDKNTKPIQGSIKDFLDRRPGTWPSQYDEIDAQEYHEWFIKGTNVKLGFDYIDADTGNHCWYKIVCDGYDQMDLYDTENDFLEDIEWVLMNKDLTWRYYE
jgi:hypothetical protein